MESPVGVQTTEIEVRNPAAVPSARGRPRVSVLLPAYNAQAYVAQSVESILNQSFTDFELIVVDDCSTDETLTILEQYRDQRLRIVRSPRNLGVVGARNRAMEVARGELIASFDADDVSLPTRLAKQVAYLDAHPEAVLVGTASFYLENGESLRGKNVPNATPMLMRWMLHVGNPLGHPTLMYRASAVQALGFLLSEDFKYAEDFEFYHRLLRVGELGYLDDPLILYRRHAGAISARHQGEMSAQAGRVLAGAYAKWFGAEAATAADLVATYLIAQRKPPDLNTIKQLGSILTRVADAFLASHVVNAADQDAILRHAGSIWWNVVRGAVRSGQVNALGVAPPEFAQARRDSFGLKEAMLSAASGLFPLKRTVVPAMRHLLGTLRAAPAPGGPKQLFGVDYTPAPVDPERPATLFVVVDTEAEFDWSANFDRSQTAVTAMRAVERGQAVFDRYGLRPVYVVDYAVATQPEGFLPLRAIHDRGGCELGAHLHPWITPPFEEALSISNSYAGNLPADLERRKLAMLLDAFRDSFGFRAKFFKTGRYGVGPNTMQLLIDNGIRVDFSVIPGRDLTSKGGPDFRSFTSAMQSVGAQPGEARILSVPMTRGPIGLLSSHHGGLPRHLESAPIRQLLIPGALSRLGILETVTLTPEAEPASKQVALVRTMLARKERQFVLHYHSPSLAAGYTPYARTPDEADRIVRRLEAVCRTFFEVLGGVPGNPQDLLPPQERTPWPNVMRTVAGWGENL